MDVCIYAMHVCVFQFFFFLFVFLPVTADEQMRELKPSLANPKHILKCQSRTRTNLK